jgi:translation initiation factor eIF-2B subunit gamma
MEFHAFIFCGDGKGLTPFSQTRVTGVPKALLPIANRPMIDYVLEWCDRAFFPHITIVCNDKSKADISKALASFQEQREGKAHEHQVLADDYRTVSPAYIDVVGMEVQHLGEALYKLYQSASAATAGSADREDTQLGGAASSSTNSVPGSARPLFRPRAPHFVFLPCDFLTNLPPQVLIDAYRNRPDSDLALLVVYRNQFDNLNDKKIFSKTFALQNHYTCYSRALEDDYDLRLLDLYAHEDVEFHKALQLRTQMSWRYPNFSVATRLLTSSILFGDATAIFATIRANAAKFSEHYFRHRTVAKVVRDLARRSWRHAQERETVGLMILPPQAEFYRCNNIAVYMEANRLHMRQHAQTAATSLSAAAHNKLAAIVGADSIVSPDATLGERTNVKRSVVGPGCKIGKRVKLTGCVLLNHVTVDDDVHLENCIVGHHAVVQSKAKLINCNVESTLEVGKATQAKGENLLCLSLEGIVEEEGTESGSDDSDDYAIGESLSEGFSDSATDSDGELDERGDNSDGLFAY